MPKGIRRAYEDGSNIVMAWVQSDKLGLYKQVIRWERYPVPRQELFDFLTADPSARFKYFKNALKHEENKRKGVKET